jgi:hypothetical protein
MSWTAQQVAITGGTISNVQITGLPAPVNPGDAATKAYVDSSGSAAALNALNYGVIGNGSTNDAAALNAFFTTASNAGAVAFIPGGKTYNLGSTSLTVPDGLIVECGRTATLTRSADQSGATPYSAFSGAMIAVGNYCSWKGGILNNTAVSTTSSTSNTIGTGSKTFTVGAGLPYTASTFLRIWSRSNPANKFEGLVTSYSGTTLVLNAAFTGGSGTFTDWNVTFGAVYQSPMVLHGVTESVIENVRVAGNWYVGLLMDGWNPSSGGSLAVKYCAFKNCFFESVQNRAIYLYGRTLDNLIDGCFMDGGAGVTDYTFNINPANATGTANASNRNKIVGCASQGAAFQGFEIGDLAANNIVANCQAGNMTDVSSVGFLIQLANTQVPLNNTISGCVAAGCIGQGYFIDGCSNNNIVGCSANASGVGFEVAVGSGSAGENSLQSIQAMGNTTGVLVGAGATNTLITGRSATNSTQLSDSGTGTNSTGLMTT